MTDGSAAPDFDPVQAMEALFDREERIISTAREWAQAAEDESHIVLRKAMDVMRALAAQWKQVTPDDLLPLASVPPYWDAGQRMAMTYGMKACAMGVERIADQLLLIETEIREQGS